MEKLLLIDGNSIANRAYYALPFLSNKEGKPSGAVFGFANIIIKLLQEERPDYVVVAFDHARKTFRNEIYSEYKMQRKPAPVELITQFPVIKEMLDAMGIKYFEQEGIEADDIIGTLSKKFTGETIVLSGDKDLLQLIDDKTTIWLTKKGVSDVDKVNEERLNELFGLKPYQIIELKALMGDTSDNIPGVKGIGEKTALSLLEKFQSVDNLYANINEITGKNKEKLIADKEMAYISKTLATINRECEINTDFKDCKYEIPFPGELYLFFEKMNFSSLIKNKSLYQEIKEKKIEVKKEKLTREILENIVFEGNVFCYDFKNLEFLINGIYYYLEKNFTLFEEPIELKDVCFKLKNVFENKDILKISKSIKDDMHFLEELGIKLENYFDLTLADYLVSAGIKRESIFSVDTYQKKKQELEIQIKDKGLEKIFYEIEAPLVKLLYQMENRGFKLNKTTLYEIGEDFNGRIEKLKQEIFIEADEEFNINSPKQVAHILFEKLGILTYNNKKQSTSASVLEEIRYIPIVDKILTYRKYSKLINTYIDVYKSHIESKGDIIHTTFNQTLTNTGRLSSSEPNLQNIPTRDDDGKVLRKIFISKFENGKIISADYSQIELRLLADMSEEEKLIEAYMNGDDIHAATASQIFNIPIEEVTQNKRRDAKAINFGIIYGISDYGLSQNIKSTRALAKSYIDSYFEKYPKVKEFMDKNVEIATKKGFAVTKWGRIRLIPELSSSKYLTRTFGERVAMNMPLQGTASDIIKYAMLKVDEKLKEKQLKSQLILQIHDELIIDTYPGEEKEVLKILKGEMEDAIALKVPLIVSIGIGESLYDCK